MAPVIAKSSKLLVKLHHRQPVQFGQPCAQPRARLNPALVAELGRPGPNHLPHDLLQQVQLTADRLDPHALTETHAPDLRSRLHNQHPEKHPANVPRVDYGPKPRSRGSLLDADHPGSGVTIARRSTRNGRETIVPRPRLQFPGREFAATRAGLGEDGYMPKQHLGIQYRGQSHWGAGFL